MGWRLKALAHASNQTDSASVSASKVREFSSREFDPRAFLAILLVNNQVLMSGTSQFVVCREQNWPVSRQRTKLNIGLWARPNYQRRNTGTSKKLSELSVGPRPYSPRSSIC